MYYQLSKTDKKIEIKKTTCLFFWNMKRLDSVKEAVMGRRLTLEHRRVIVADKSKCRAVIAA